MSFEDRLKQKAKEIADSALETLSGASWDNMGPNDAASWAWEDFQNGANWGYAEAKKEMGEQFSPARIDKIVCNWSMQLGVALTESQLNSLVDAIAIPVPKSINDEGSPAK